MRAGWGRSSRSQANDVEQLGGRTLDKRDFAYDEKKDEYRCPAGQIAIYRFTSEENGKTLHEYWSSECPQCPMKPRCTKSKYRRIARWEHEDVLDVVQGRLDGAPEAMRLRRHIVEHVFSLD